jgi:radical SAM superfamily enzyme YgiQ (UPF0313 family)
MSDVLFTHSYFLTLDPKEFRAMMPYAPLGTLYAAAYARRAGFSVSLFDAMLATSEEEILTALRRDRPKFTVIYDDDFNYLTKMCLSRMRVAAFRMSRLAREQGSIVIVHSSDAADHVEEYLDNGAEYVVFGEGEITLGELLVALGTEERDVSAIRGVAYRREQSVIRNPARDVLRDLDALPLPARDLVDIEAYNDLWLKHHGHTSMNIVTTRGCPFHCNWCAKPLYGQVYNSRSPQSVVDEFALLKSTYHPDHLWICDDIFGLKPGWIAEFASLISKHDAGIPFKCLSRADLLLKEDNIRDLARAGCRTVWIGAESGSQKILDAMEKGTTVGQIVSASRKLREYGIRTGFFLQYGYPGETREDIDLTLQMVRDCLPDEIGISISYPLPGTPFYNTVLGTLGEKRNWIDSEDLDLMFPGTYPPDYYRTLHRVTHKRFRIWEGLKLARSVMTHPARLDRYAIRRIASVGYHVCTLPPLLSRLRGFESTAREHPTTL